MFSQIYNNICNTNHNGLLKFASRIPAVWPSCAAVPQYNYFVLKLRVLTQSQNSCEVTASGAHPEQLAQTAQTAQTAQKKPPLSWGSCLG
jgi:hypothetical protein